MVRATPIISTKDVFADGWVVQIRVWAVPKPVPPGSHLYKYSLFYGRAGVRVVAYDNERGKGGHRHLRDVESPYEFVSVEQLVDDFMADVAAIRGGNL